MLRPPRPATTVAVAALVVLAGVAPALAATDATATDHGADGDSLDATTSPDENATVDAWRVPGHVDAANASASDLASYGNATAGPTNVTPRDRLVVDVTVPGLDARVANVSGNASANLTTRVLAALNASGHLVVRQTVDTTAPSLQARSLWLNATNVDARDAPGDDRYLLVVDPARVLAVHASPFEHPSAAAAEYRDESEDYRFDGVFEDGLDAQAVYTARYYANDSVSGLAATSRRVRFRPAAAFVAATGPLEPAANATVAGTTTLAPGTDLVVEARTDAGVVATAVATVDDRGRYAATLDLAAVDAPASVNLTVALAANRSRTLTRAPTTLAVRDPRGIVRFDDQNTSTRYVSARANLTHGGVLVLRTDAGVVDQTTVLDAGVDQTVTFSLPANAANGTYRVVAYRVRDDGTRGERYANGSASARIAVVPETATTTRTTTATTPTTSTTATTSATTATRTNEGSTVDPTTPVSEDPIPGFGAAVALAALAATLLVGRRRNRRP